MSSSRTLILVNADGQELALSDEAIRIGSAAECEVRLHGGAAPVHARVSRERIEAISACILGSVPLEPGRSRLLAGACVLSIAGLELRIEERWDVRSASTRRLAFELLDIAAAPEIVVVEGTGADLHQKLLLGEDRDYIIGRASRCDLSLDDLAISREHVALRCAAGHVLVRDCGTTRGTFLGATRLEPGRKAVWSAEHMIRLGHTVLALRLPERQQQLLAQATEATRATEPPRCKSSSQLVSEPQAPERSSPSSSPDACPVAAHETSPVSQAAAVEVPLAMAVASAPLARRDGHRWSALDVVVAALALLALAGMAIVVYLFATA